MLLKKAKNLNRYLKYNNERIRYSLDTMYVELVGKTDIYKLNNDNHGYFYIKYLVDTNIKRKYYFKDRINGFNGMTFRSKFIYYLNNKSINQMVGLRPGTSNLRLGEMERLAIQP